MCFECQIHCVLVVYTAFGNYDYSNMQYCDHAVLITLYTNNAAVVGLGLLYNVVYTIIGSSSMAMHVLITLPTVQLWL